MSKTIFRIAKDKDNPYVMLDKRLLSDKRLSWKAKGILVYLLSKPDEWKVRMTDIVNQSTDGLDAIKSAMRELIEAGYIYREQHHASGGKWGETTYIVFEIPRTDKPLVGKPLTVKPPTDNPLYSNNDSIKVVVKGDDEKISITTQVTRLLCEVTGMVAIPPSGVEYIDLMASMIESHGYDETKRRMSESYDVWKERKGKNGRLYSKTNLKWLEYALVDEPPIEGKPVPPSITGNGRYTQPSNLDQYPVFHAGDEL